MNTANRINEALEAHDEISETLGDLETQYQGECALYGDAGAGQGTDIARLRNELARVESEIAALANQPSFAAFQASI